MSSMMGTPSKKFSWIKKMDAKIKKSLSKEDSTPDEPRRTKSSPSEGVEIVRKSE
jgi:hypothetical protein